MATVDLYNLKKERVGTIDLADEVFATEVKEHLFHEVVRAQLACRRGGNAKAKGRAEVSGTNAKPFKQKGTGRGRQGDVKNPTHVGGGVAFGPLPRDYSYRPPRKVRQGAVKSALSKRLQEQKLWVVDNADLPEIKTRRVLDVCKAFGFENVLFIDGKNDALSRSISNIPRAHFLAREGLNCYDLLLHEHIVMTKSAVEYITGTLTR